jgi:S-adenosylmethionine hydrolase
MLDWPQPVVSPGKIEGEILDVDSFGNLVTNIEAEMLAAIPDKQQASVDLGKQKTEGIRFTYGDAPPGSLVALVGSSGRLELAIVGGGAAEQLDVGIGAPVILNWPQATGGSRTKPY